MSKRTDASPRTWRRIDWTVLHLQWPGCAVEVWADSAALARAVGLLWPVIRPAHRRLDTPPLARFVLTTGRTPGAPACRLSHSDGTARDFATVGAALAELDRRLSASLVDHLVGTYLLVEAAVVGTPAGAIVLPGPASPWRAALAMALVLSGFEYLSGDLMVVDVRTLHLLPCPGPLRLATTDWRWLTAPLKMPTASWPVSDTTGSEWRLAAPSRPSVPDRVWSLQAILVAPEQPPGATSAIVPLPPSRMLLALVRHALNLPRFGELGIGALACLSEAARGYILTDDHPAAAAAAVRQTLGQPAGDGRGGPAREKPAVTGVNAVSATGQKQTGGDTGGDHCQLPSPAPGAAWVAPAAVYVKPEVISVELNETGRPAAAPRAPTAAPCIRPSQATAPARANRRRGTRPTAGE